MAFETIGLKRLLRQNLNKVLTPFHIVAVVLVFVFFLKKRIKRGNSVGFRP